MYPFHWHPDAAPAMEALVRDIARWIVAAVRTMKASLTAPSIDPESYTAWQGGWGAEYTEFQRRERALKAERAEIANDRAEAHGLREKSLKALDEAERISADAARVYAEAAGMVEAAERVRAETRRTLQEIEERQRKALPIESLARLEAALDALKAVERVRDEAEDVLNGLRQPLLTALDDPAFKPKPVTVQDWATGLTGVFPAVRDRVVIAYPASGTEVFVRVPERSTELLALPANQVPAWVQDLAPGTEVYAYVSVADDPDIDFNFSKWEYPAPAIEGIVVEADTADDSGVIGFITSEQGAALDAWATGTDAGDTVSEPSRDLATVGAR